MNSIKLTFISVMVLLQYRAGFAKKRNFKDMDISNEVLIEEEFETLPGLSGFRSSGLIIESNAIPEIRDLVPSVVKTELSTRLRNDGYDPFFLDDLLIRTPSEGLYADRWINVSLDHGVLVGLSDFHTIDTTKKGLPKNYFQMLLMWNRLRVHYRVTVDRGGLKNDGEVDLDIGRLLMDVQIQKKQSKFPNIQMSKVTEMMSKLSGLDALLDDFKITIRLEIEKKIRNFLNNKVSNILLKYVEEVLSGSEENKLSSYYSPL